MSKKTVHNTNCCVYGCHSRKNMDRSIHFHYFPKKGDFVYTRNSLNFVEKVDRRKAWIKVLLMGKPVTPTMRVCSLHFNPEDYHGKGIVSSRLKRSTVPSLKLPQRKHFRTTQMTENQRSERMERRNMLREQHRKSKSLVEENICQMDVENKVDTTNIPEPHKVTLKDLNAEERDCVQGLLLLHSTVELTALSKATQVASGDFSVTFSSLIKDEKHLNSLTGIPTFQLLDSLTNLVTKFYPDKRATKISVRDRIIIVFMKLKMGIKFIVLAFLFKVTQPTVRTIFDKYVSYLANVLKSQIRWPSSEECRQNIPLAFKNFETVRVILDCTEIPLQKPSCLCCRIRTYSHYKGGQTLKVMIGITPGGLISFVSKCYGGRASDKAIFEQSNLIKQLKRLDSIMVDKGFLIDDLCNRYEINIIRPYFLRKKKQFSTQEALTNVEISRARVHIERINQRIKTFQIFRTALPWNIVNKIDEIFIIVCAMVNLEKPILADDKFLK